MKMRKNSVFVALKQNKHDFVQVCLGIELAYYTNTEACLATERSRGHFLRTQA